MRSLGTARPSRPFVALALLALSVLLLGACSTYRDDLARGETAFEQNNHERALAIFRSLELDVAHLTPPERAHYLYLRGMTDYRIGFRADARHWLLLARAMDASTPGMLPEDWKSRLKDALAELDETVYTQGIATLTNSRQKPKSDEPEAEAPKKKARSEDIP